MAEQVLLYLGKWYLQNAPDFTKIDEEPLCVGMAGPENLKILHSGKLCSGISGKLSSGMLGKLTFGTLVNFAAELW
jgi:hypothetical protein